MGRRELLDNFETENLIFNQASLKDCKELVLVLQSWEEQEFVTGEVDASVSYFDKVIKSMAWISLRLSD